MAFHNDNTFFAAKLFRSVTDLYLELLVHHPILAVVSATPLLQTNIVLPTTLLATPTLITTMMEAPPQTYLVDGNTTTCLVLLSTPEQPGQRAPLWTGS